MLALVRCLGLEVFVVVNFVAGQVSHALQGALEYIFSLRSLLALSCHLHSSSLVSQIQLPFVDSGYFVGGGDRSGYERDRSGGGEFIGGL
jgi:hypothetical protein